MERQDGAAFCFQFVADAIDALAKLLDVFVGLEILGNLGVAREMGVADVIGAHQSWQVARRLEDDAVVEHLDLNLRPLDVVGPVAQAVDHHLLYGVL